MKLSRSQFLKLSVLAGLFLLIKGVTQVVAQGASDPLPSWNNGSVKSSIIKFVTEVTTEESSTFVPIDDRIATFNNDGTLWCEQPIIQVLSVKNKFEEVVAANPSLREKQPFKAALEGDTAYLVQAGEEAIMQLLAATVANQTEEEFRTSDGKNYIWRLPEISRINDKAGKPVGIDLHIGKRPIFAAGNVRSGGDIAMLSYSQGQPNSFQLLINHDDAEREFAYSEKDNASLSVAKINGWSVVSIKNDWKQVFSFQK